MIKIDFIKGFFLVAVSIMSFSAAGFSMDLERDEDIGGRCGKPIAQTEDFTYEGQITDSARVFFVKEGIPGHQITTAHLEAYAAANEENLGEDGNQIVTVRALAAIRMCMYLKKNPNQAVSALMESGFDAAEIKVQTINIARALISSEFPVRRDTIIKGHRFISENGNFDKKAFIEFLKKGLKE